MKLKLFRSPSRSFSTRPRNPLFLQTSFLTKVETPGLALNLKQLEFLPKIMKNFGERNIKYHQANVNFNEAKKFESNTPYYTSSLTPYSFYAFAAMNCFHGFWYDSLIDRDIAEQIVKQGGNDNFSLESITDNRDQLDISRLAPPLMEELFTVLHRIPAISYDSSQELIITANYTPPSLDRTEQKLPMSLPMLNLRSDLIFKLALYFDDIFKLIGQSWLHTKIHTPKFLFTRSSDNDSEKAKLRERMLQLSGELLRQHAEIMHTTAKFIHLMNSSQQNNENKFSLNDLSDIMKSWNIPTLQLIPYCHRKDFPARPKSLNDNEKNGTSSENNFEEQDLSSEKQQQSHDNDQKYPKLGDIKKLEEVLAKAAKYGRYY